MFADLPAHLHQPMSDATPGTTRAPNIISDPTTPNPNISSITDDLLAAQNLPIPSTPDHQPQQDSTETPLYDSLQRRIGRTPEGWISLTPGRHPITDIMRARMLSAIQIIDNMTTDMSETLGSQSTSVAPPADQTVQEPQNTNVQPAAPADLTVPDAAESPLQDLPFGPAAYARISHLLPTYAPLPDADPAVPTQAIPTMFPPTPLHNIAIQDLSPRDRDILMSLLPPREVEASPTPSSESSGIWLFNTEDSGIPRPLGTIPAIVTIFYPDPYTDYDNYDPTPPAPHGYLTNNQPNLTRLVQSATHRALNWLTQAIEGQTHIFDSPVFTMHTPNHDRHNYGSLDSPIQLARIQLHRFIQHPPFFSAAPYPMWTSLAQALNLPGNVFDHIPSQFWNLHNASWSTIYDILRELLTGQPTPQLSYGTQLMESYRTLQQQQPLDRGETRTSESTPSNSPAPSTPNPDDHHRHTTTAHANVMWNNTTYQETILLPNRLIDLSNIPIEPPNHDRTNTLISPLQVAIHECLPLIHEQIQAPVQTTPVGLAVHHLPYHFYDDVNDMSVLRSHLALALGLPHYTFGRRDLTNDTWATILKFLHDLYAFEHARNNRPPPPEDPPPSETTPVPSNTEMPHPTAPTTEEQTTNSTQQQNDNSDNDSMAERMEQFLNAAASFNLIQPTDSDHTPPSSDAPNAPTTTDNTIPSTFHQTDPLVAYGSPFPTLPIQTPLADRIRVQHDVHLARSQRTDEYFYSHLYADIRCERNAIAQATRWSQESVRDWTTRRWELLGDIEEGRHPIITLAEAIFLEWSEDQYAQDYYLTREAPYQPNPDLSHFDSFTARLISYQPSHARGTTGQPAASSWEVPAPAEPPASDESDDPEMPDLYDPSLDTLAMRNGQPNHPTNIRARNEDLPSKYIRLLPRDSYPQPPPPKANPPRQPPMPQAPEPPNASQVWPKPPPPNPPGQFTPLDIPPGWTGPWPRPGSPTDVIVRGMTGPQGDNVRARVAELNERIAERDAIIQREREQAARFAHLTELAGLRQNIIMERTLSDYNTPAQARAERATRLIVQGIRQELASDSDSEAPSTLSGFNSEDQRHIIHNPSLGYAKDSPNPSTNSDISQPRNPSFEPSPALTPTSQDRRRQTTSQTRQHIIRMELSNRGSAIIHVPTQPGTLHPEIQPNQSYSHHTGLTNMSDDDSHLSSTSSHEQTSTVTNPTNASPETNIPEQIHLANESVRIRGLRSQRVLRLQQIFGPPISTQALEFYRYYQILWMHFRLQNVYSPPQHPNHVLPFHNVERHLSQRYSRTRTTHHRRSRARWTT